MLTLVIAMTALVAASDANYPNAETIMVAAIAHDRVDVEETRRRFQVGKDRTTEELDEKGKTLGLGDSEPEEKRLVITIQKVLKPGRFRYEPVKCILQVDGRSAYSIGFHPGDPANQPEPEPRPTLGERFKESVLNRVLNSLNGTVYVDVESGAIIKFEAHLNEELRILIGAIYDLRVEFVQKEFVQKEWDDIWVPVSTRINIRYTRVRPFAKHRRRITISFVLQPLAP